MIKTLISIAVVVAVAFVGWGIYEQWLKVQNEKQEEQQKAAASVVNPDALEGVPSELLQSLTAAEQHGAGSLGSWLKMYGARIQDPRKAWIQLDYVVMISRDNPGEARHIFGEVKDRTLPDSRVWPRIQEMAKTYE